jgi:3-deoxy-D-manno-octulosonic-acid transferase
LRECRRKHIKTALVNGRLSKKSFGRYKLIQNFIKRVLEHFDLALMSAEPDAQRLIALGCAPEKVVVTGNIKFDVPLDSSENELTRYFRERFDFEKNQSIIIAASTHENEEQIILEAFQITLEKNEKKKLRLLLVPRHPERFEKIADLLAKSNYGFARRSHSISLNDKNATVILLDSIGELRSAFPLGKIVFVGGSLFPHGGHNVLEPIAAQTCVVTGFYTFNFASIVNDLVQRNALVQLPQLEKKDAALSLAALFSELLVDNKKRALLVENAVAFLETNRGATDLNTNYLKDLVDLKNTGEI